MPEFQAAVIDECFERCIEKFKSLALANPSTLSEIKERLERELSDFKKRGLMTIAFVGEYSSGKSTIISALTQRRDILISADIATDRTTPYEWNNIRLIDTPGLFTEHKDHDEITYDAIRQADLLAFCLTYALFDSITVENFKKLAYEDRYCNKMMLVINKMSAEAGDDESKIKNYTKSLAAALQGHPLEAFPLCFIDARDYMDGIDGKDGELQDGSRFETFVGALNSFVKEKGALGRLDTPIRIAIGHLRDASSVLSRSTQEDNAFLELLNRLSKAVDRDRDRLRNKVRGISAELSAQVTGIGIKLSQMTGTPDQLDSESKAAECKISGLIESACGQLETAVQQAQGSLQNSIKDILSSDLMLQFCARLDAGQVSVDGVQVKDGVSRLNSQVKSLGNIGSKVGLEVGRLAQGSKAAQGLLSASGASGSVLHQGVLSAGKLIGYSFKPWQAVNLAKTIGNVAKVLGPVLSIVTVVMEVANVYEEAENERKLSEGRKTVVDDFMKMADGLEHQFEAQLREVEKELHDRVETDINAARLKEETEIAASNDKVAVAVEIRADLDRLLEKIAQQFEIQKETVPS